MKDLIPTSLGPNPCGATFSFCTKSAPTPSLRIPSLPEFLTCNSIPIRLFLTS